MIDPNSTVAGALAGGLTSTISLALGAQLDAFIIGMVAAVFASIWLDTIDKPSKAAAAVFFSALLAGYGSPVLAGWVEGSAAALASSSGSLRLLLAFLIGAVAPRLVPLVINNLVPLAIKYVGNKIGGDKS